MRALGFDEAFIRMWEFYFSYCEGAFEERYIGDVQMLLAKPLYRQPGSPGSDRRESASGEEAS
jgi:cyclopropane-fatty-acyl-phospholipid synthase